MFTKGKTFLFCVILAGITAVATLCLTLYSDAASKYSSDSNKQLQSTALGLVKKIRGLVDSYNKTEHELRTEYDKNYLASRTTERQPIRDQRTKKWDEAHDSTVRNYKTTFLSESTAIRRELHRRLPERLHRPNLSKLYEDPSTVMGIQIIADDLEVLSKSLPDT